MDWMIWTGAALSLGGVFGLIWCVLQALKARKAGLADDALRAALQRLVPYNMLALLLSGIGLMLVVVGILLG